MSIRMKLHTLPVSIPVAALIGAAHTLLLLSAWAQIGLHTPVPDWLRSIGLAGAAYHRALFPADFLINMALSIPTAFLLCKLRPARMRVYLVAALLPGFCWLYQGVLADLPHVENWRMLLPGLLQQLLPLPVTALIMQRAIGARGSFKPELLRG